ncbi:iduronate sulfatase [Nocardioides currus]|uniref:Iduronate sulfatase n=2 Tax=Nocardioides currus TaxID=2133958 RepID=A0A2R7Z3C5_9ACTN|nr:iduronate sulfatase [Nocardioides currus]
MPPPVAQARPHSTSPAVVATAWMVALVTMGYMIPWAVAVSRSAPNHAAVGLVNFLSGWTIIGWFVALVMSLRPVSDPSRAPW